ncbi:DNRLRE domain-containing protein, partial [Bacteroidales bacterium OttesenSCG-928-M11]|nr:DNRLRE domain-containing protein [Bacteroidales bacterium OttesenSCG-928-M11]
DILTDEIEVYVADPSRKKEQVDLIIRNHPLLGDKELNCKLNNNSAYGGSTHEFVIDKNTTDYVHIYVEGVSLPEKLSMSSKNRYEQLTPVITPANARVQTVTWSSSDENIVSVGQNGELFAYENGEATITVTTDEGDFQAECKVVVGGSFKSSISLADSYVYDGSASSNYGTATSITVKKDNSGYDRAGYFKFSIADLENLKSGESAKATVVLYALSGGATVTEVSWLLYPVSNLTWDEKTITWSNKPAAGTTVIAQKKCIKPASSDFTTTSVLEFDLTDYVLSEYEKGNKEISFMMTQNARAASGGGTSTISSKEDSDVRKQPRMLIEFTDGVNIEDIASEKVEIYPSVTTGLVFISVTELNPIQVFDLNGKMLINFIPSSVGEVDLDLSSYPAGLYFVKTGSTTQKVIKR